MAYANSAISDQTAPLTLCQLVNFSCLFVICYFFKIIFFEKKIRNTIRVSNSLDPDQARQNVGPDLDPNSLQKLSADATSRQRVKWGIYCLLKAHMQILHTCSKCVCEYMNTNFMHV